MPMISASTEAVKICDYARAIVSNEECRGEVRRYRVKGGRIRRGLEKSSLTIVRSTQTTVGGGDTLLLKLRTCSYGCCS